MEKGNVDLLVEKWLNDPGFREKMKRDPEGTVKSSGIALTAQEWVTVRQVVMSSSDEALLARVSKGSLN